MCDSNDEHKHQLYHKHTNIHRPTTFGQRFIALKAQTLRNTNLYYWSTSQVTHKVRSHTHTHTHTSAKLSLLCNPQCLKLQYCDTIEQKKDQSHIRPLPSFQITRGSSLKHIRLLFISQMVINKDKW